MAEEKKPEIIEDETLDEASGGLPAVQKIRDAANRVQEEAALTKSGAGTMQLSGSSSTN